MRPAGRKPPINSPPQLPQPDAGQATPEAGGSQKPGSTNAAASGKPPTPGREQASPAAQHSSSETETNGGTVELGFEPFGAESGSQRIRALWEERRARAQRRDRVIRRVWYSAILLFLLIICVIAGWSVVTSHSPFCSDPPDAPESEDLRGPEIAP